MKPDATAMKPVCHLLFGLALVTAWTFARAQTAAPSPTPYGNVVAGYQLDWADEFDGPTLDLDKWYYRTDSKMWSTQLPENVSVSDGKLKIALRKQTAGGKDYTGGGIISKRLFQYGYYEASFKVPPASGWHTSFWAMKDVAHGATAPSKAQEIDFCEQDSVKLTNYSAGVIAWGDNEKWFGRQYVQTPNLHEGFHVWACEFTPLEVKFFFDGKLTHKVAATGFKQGPQNIWLTCIACNYGGTKSVADDALPATAEFEYVRFFEKSPLLK